VRVLKWIFIREAMMWIGDEKVPKSESSDSWESLCKMIEMLIEIPPQDTRRFYDVDKCLVSIVILPRIIMFAVGSFFYDSCCCSIISCLLLFLGASWVGYGLLSDAGHFPVSTIKPAT